MGAFVNGEDGVADLPQVLEDIERRLQRGERPVVA
jgi:phosphonoacetaldehyde hydrolase